MDYVLIVGGVLQEEKMEKNTIAIFAIVWSTVQLNVKGKMNLNMKLSVS